MDDVSRHLRRQGFSPRAEYFLASDFLLGYTIETEHFTLTYRQEGPRLILCDFAAREADGKAVQALLTLVKRTIAAVPSVAHVDAMILAEPGDPALDQARNRLAQVLLAEGARPTEINGDLWLRYLCRA
ncbi:MAG: hypothetical protein JO171_02800 [Paludibacterium sp.]|uniref:hypothetical protein n=1 Tax=Paludibacterium sp. TaxID=1917523 RepID=UPI0025DA88A0|nr:hypothetical protein [Paludibacterium sp.]MBV8046054.1 hypothetical protein [Paludibacterium sp.]MBV8646143.1 hypothetical protein [Paludibacterium sp.]